MESWCGALLSAFTAKNDKRRPIPGHEFKWRRRTIVGRKRRLSLSAIANDSNASLVRCGVGHVSRQQAGETSWCPKLRRHWNHVRFSSVRCENLLYFPNVFNSPVQILPLLSKALFIIELEFQSRNGIVCFSFIGRSAFRPDLSTKGEKGTKIRNFL